MSEASERLTGSSWDVESLLTDALRPIEPPERLSGRRRGHPLGGHPGRRRGALRLGRGALRERAAGAARSPQLGPPGGRGRRRRRRHRRPGPAGAAPPQQAAGRKRPALAYRRPALAALTRPSPVVPLALPRDRGIALRGARRGGEAEQADRQVQAVVAAVGGEEAEDRVAGADREAPDRQGGVEQADAERVLARGVAGEQQAERAGGDLEQVEPGVDPQHAERRFDVARGAEGGAVEEADDPEDDEAARRPRSRTGVRGWRPPSAPIVGCHVPMAQTCYRHPDRETGVSCSSCGRPICPECMTPTPVGMRCPECMRQRTKVVRNPTGTPGQLSAFPATIVLIAINVVVYLIEIAGGPGGISSPSGSFVEPLRPGRLLRRRRRVVPAGDQRLPAR